MREKVLKLREQLMKELDDIEPGEVVSLSNYSKEVIDLILFDGIEDDDTRINSIDEYGKRASKKVFALPEEYLEKIDFSNVDFTNFHASSFDFSKLHGVNIDPQSVYANSLIFSKLKNVNFIGSFNNVSINGADFTGSTNAQITPLLLHADLDYSETLFLKNYDGQFTINLSGCNFRDVTFIPDAFMGKFYEASITPTIVKGKDIIDKYTFNLAEASFEGSKNAFVNVQDIESIRGINLKDAIVPNKTIDRDLKDINFGGAKMAKSTSPRHLKKAEPIAVKPEGHDLTGCSFNGVRFVGGFKNSDISNCNFTGSIDANIDLKLVNSHSKMASTDFTDAKVRGYDGQERMVTQDGRLAKKMLTELDEKLNLALNSSIIASEEKEKAHAKKIEDNKKAIEETSNKLSMLLLNMEKLGLSEEELYGKVSIDQELFLVRVEDHLEINRNFVDKLRFLNLSMIDFTNVNVAGLDFRNTGARINPQTVYNKDISYCTFDSANIKFFDSFKGVNTQGLNLDECDFRLKDLINNGICV